MSRTMAVPSTKYWCFARISCDSLASWEGEMNAQSSVPFALDPETHAIEPDPVPTPSQYTGMGMPLENGGRGPDVLRRGVEDVAEHRKAVADQRAGLVLVGEVLAEREVEDHPRAGG